MSKGSDLAALRSASGIRAAQGAASDAKTSLLDAAERLLVERGYAAISTRLLASEAGVNLGLIHYYFGTMEELFLQTLERFTDRLTERQEILYGSDLPFPHKWRTAMRYLIEDGQYQKIWLELQAMSWNEPSLRSRVCAIHAAWTTIVRRAVGEAYDEHGIDPERLPLEAMVSLILTFNQGVVLERVNGIDSGHAALLAWIQRIVDDLMGDG